MIMAETTTEILFNNLYTYHEDDLIKRRSLSDYDVKKFFENLYLFSKILGDTDNLPVISAKDVGNRFGNNKVTHLSNLFRCKNFEEIRDCLIEWTEGKSSRKLITLMIHQKPDSVMYYVNVQVYLNG